MIRNELEIVYATLKGVVSSFHQLESEPRFVFDYDPEDVEAGPFPTVGMRRFSDLNQKLIDKSEEYDRITVDGKTYAWYEAGRFDFGITVGMFMSGSEVHPNPMPFLRHWQNHITKRLLQQVSFKTVGDVVPSESIRLACTSSPFEQHGKRLYSIKLSINATGKYLDAVELKELSHNHQPKPWIVHSDPGIFDR
ncbi:hypothetical protein POF51_22495 [Brevibacillus sp. AG]|uniref:hypothetical protein n=1 Tax=Brevibacillus sp. AG TaxID=3020891 RepID=UPI00232D834C|nr:hypothetical protein [Brevibacillus sp. AG]MDC0763499.1 hypothetical protein [Brevibacillus sp. AG]